MTGLNPQMEAFCLAYAKSANATQSYKEAGYKVTNDRSAAASAARLLTNANVKKRLQEIVSEQNKGKIMDIAEAQERLSAIARRTEQEIVYLADGTAIPKPAAIRDAIKAMELLGRMQGAFVDRQQVEVSGTVPVVIKDNIRE